MPHRHRVTAETRRRVEVSLTILVPIVRVLVLFLSHAPGHLRAGPTHKIQVSQGAGLGGVNTTDRRIEYALMLIEERYMQALTLKTISGELNLTREHFCRLFKAETGLTPAKYIKTLKLQRGKYLLENTFLSVKQITHKVGLNDESHFVKDFKLTYGVTPARYRCRQQNESLSLTQDGNINIRQ